MAMEGFPFHLKIDYMPNSTPPNSVGVLFIDII